MEIAVIKRKLRNARIKISRKGSQLFYYPSVYFRKIPQAKKGAYQTSLKDLNLDYQDELLTYLDQVIEQREFSDQAVRTATFRKELFRIDDILISHSPLLDFALQDKLLQKVSEYLPFKPVLSVISLAIDYAEDSVIQRDTQFYHLDGEESYICKVFIYLSDVRVENGPFTYVPTDQVSAISLKRPKHINRSSRVTDEEMEKFGCTPISFTGQRGTVIFADTCRGYHKGLRPTAGKRKVLILSYTGNRLFSWPPFFDLPENHGIKREYLEKLWSLQNPNCLDRSWTSYHLANAPVPENEKI